MTKTHYPLFIPALLSTAFSVPAFAADEPTDASSGVNMEELYNTPLEKLVGLEYLVTSASKKEEKLLDTAAAAYVVSEEDIRRSGATSLPEALRGVPGLSVARINAHAWGISARGFNGQYANKLLVMIDGRSIYSPSFSGVYWDEQNVPLENIKRIEIVRGPGATLWGANAVNGVINIITKSAQDTQGNLVSMGTGTIDTVFGTVRHGGKFGEDGFYRVYANTTDDVNKAPIVAGGPSQNYSWHMSHAGFRTDWGQNTSDGFMVEGDMFSGSEHDDNQSPFTSSLYPKGGNIMGQWIHSFSTASRLQVQTSVDTDNRPYNALDVARTTYDANFQHTYRGFDRQEIVWGGGARFTDERTGAGAADFPFSYTFNPQDKLIHVFNGFVQDQYALIPNKWFLTLGSKLEENSYTGVEIQPSIRTLWKINDKQSVWAAATRAVRTPSYSEEYETIEIRRVPPSIFVPFPTSVEAFGNPSFESEQLFAYEAGYRQEISKDASIDISAFYNVYGNLFSSEQNAPFLSGGTLIVPIQLANETHVKTWGIEFTPAWQVTKDWSLKGNYSLFVLSTQSNGAAGPELSITTTPRNQFGITSYLNLPHAVEFDVSFRYTGSIPNFDSNGGPIETDPTYMSLNMRVGWKPFENDRMDLSLAGDNLFNRQHYESNSIQIPQDIIAKATVKF